MRSRFTSFPFGRTSTTSSFSRVASVSLPNKTSTSPASTSIKGGLHQPFSRAILITVFTTPSQASSIRFLSSNTVDLSLADAIEHSHPDLCRCPSSRARKSHSPDQTYLQMQKAHYPEICLTSINSCLPISVNLTFNPYTPTLPPFRQSLKLLGAILCRPRERYVTCIPSCDLFDHLFARWRLQFKLTILFTGFQRCSPANHAAFRTRFAHPEPQLK